MSGFRLELKTFEARFRMRFSHASASRSKASSVVCMARGDDGVTGYGEGCPREYVTKETIKTTAVFFTKHRRDIEASVSDLKTLQHWIGENKDSIDANPAAFAAIEIALLDLFARRENQPLERFLGLSSPTPLPVSSVFGVTSMLTTAILASAYKIFGMTDAKVKLSNDPIADRKRIKMIRRILGSSMRLRVDANNLFSVVGHCAQHLGDVDPGIWAVEEPLRPRDVGGQGQLATLTGAKIILDESAIRPEDFRDLDRDHWIVNLRISKLGGLLRSIGMFEAARSAGMHVIIGSHVGETGLLARCALSLAAACGDLLLATECGYGSYLLKHDLTRPSLGFNRRGLLAAGQQDVLANPGLGLGVDETLLGDIPT